MPIPSDIPGGGGATGIYLSGLPGADAWWALFQGDWRKFLQLWLDPFDLWFDKVFSGRPKLGKDSATDSVALFLIPSANPVVSMWGMGVRALEAQGIPLSTSNPVNRLKYQNLARAVAQDLLAQFGSTQGTQIFAQLATLVLRCPHPDSSRTCIAQRVKYVDQPYFAAVQSGRLDPKTGFPHCPTGFHRESGKCVRNPAPAPRPAGCCS